MSGITKYLILPKEVTAFEQGYLTRLNKIALYFFWAHIPVFMLIAWVAGTGPLSALFYPVAFLIVPTILQYTLSSERAKSIVYGVTAMGMGGLLVHFGQGPVQIEMHFYFFALLAMLCMFANPTVNIVAAVTVAIHHGLVWLIHPMSVFNYDASFWVVGVHAGFVVLETVAACFISRRFFDDVIGLERIVEERTREVHLILNNIGQGFLTIDLEGVMSEERSSVVAGWFGEGGGIRAFQDYLRPIDAVAADWFELGLQSLKEAIMPEEVSLGQLPKRVVLQGPVLELTYKPIHRTDGSLEKLLIVISDITAAIRQEQAEAEQRQLMQLFEHVMRDKSGFLQFLSEADGIVEAVMNHNYRDLAHLTRLIHTLKGNAGLFGMLSVADLCHRLEDEILLEGAVPDCSRLGALQAEWREVHQKIDRLLGENKEQKIEISDADYRGLMVGLINREDPARLVKLAGSWRLETAAHRLEFIRQQAEALSQRLGKPGIEVHIEPNGIRFESARWASFWSNFSHVIRNAIDHGIESKEERGRSGKPGSGRLSIRTYAKEGELIIAVEDDGRGIDWRGIALKAREMNLPHGTEVDLMEALFRDGVTTKEVVTHFSGRGVGMGAVREECAQRSGQIEIRSTAGRGTTLYFRFPINESIYVGHSGSPLHSVK